MIWRVIEYCMVALVVVQWGTLAALIVAGTFSTIADVIRIAAGVVI